jgi:prevent-host-death family protein
MKKANIAELKNRLSHYLDRVKRGETILVMDRKTPVARIVPTPPPARMSDEETEAWLRDMEAKGILRVGARKGVPEILRTPPPGMRPTRAVEALIEDRRRR